MKLIRELRIGPPKCGKSVTVVGTYPKPMLVFLFDVDGLDSIPRKAPSPLPSWWIPLDILFDDIKFIEPDDLPAFCKKSPFDLPKVTCIRFYSTKKNEMTEAFTPIADSTPYKKFYKSVNYLVQLGCPWQTFVTDSITSLIDFMLQHISASNPTWNSNPMKWSPAAGSKILQHISVMTNLPCHCVFIGHSHTDRPEIENKEQAAVTTPLGPKYFSERVGGLVSQYFYQTNESGKCEIWTRPKKDVKAIGCRWPSDLSQVVGADFKSIYGKELI